MLMEMPAEELAGTAAELEKEGRAPENQGAASGAGEDKTARQENWVHIGPLAAAIVARAKRSREIATAAR